VKNGAKSFRTIEKMFVTLKEDFVVLISGKSLSDFSRNSPSL